MRQTVIEFVRQRLLAAEDEQRHRRLFDFFDTDKDGFLTLAEFKAGQEKLFGDAFGDGIETLFHKMDVYNEGRISFSAFVVMSMDIK